MINLSEFESRPGFGRRLLRLTQAGPIGGRRDRPDRPLLGSGEAPSLRERMWCAMSAEIVAIARFVPKPDARDRVLAALERVTIATHAEPGCILLALHAGEDGNFVQIGKWEKLDDWRAHGEAASVGELDRDIEGLLATEREIAWFRPLTVGDPGRSAIWRLS